METKIIKILLEYSRKTFKNGNGSFLAQLNFDKIKFNWCFPMFKFINGGSIVIDIHGNIDNDGDLIGGAWTPLFFNDIFLVPSIYSNGFIDILKKNKDFKKIIEYIDNYDDKSFINNEIFEKSETDLFQGDNYEKYHNLIYAILNYKKEQLYYNLENFLITDNSGKYILSKNLERIIKSSTNPYMSNVILHKSWLKNLKFFNILNNFISSMDDDNYFYLDLYENPNNVNLSDVGNIKILTTCHELYHKWQFSATPIMPIFYIANHFISQFIGYNTASKNKWFIEGDVRIYVDNEENKLEFFKIHNVIEYIKRAASLFMYKNFLKDEKFSNYHNQIKKGEFNTKISFNTFFINKININEEDYKCIDDYKERIQNYNMMENFTKKIDIRNTYEYNFILKLFKDEKILTDEFFEFLISL